jgi:hypothetical protein
VVLKQWRATFPVVKNTLNKDKGLGISSSQASRRQIASLQFVTNETIATTVSGKTFKDLLAEMLYLWLGIVCDYPQQQDFGTIDPLTFVL